MHLKSLISLACTVLLFSCTTMAPEGTPPRASHPMGTLIDIYQHRLDHLSAVRAGECPMYPSCSAYSAEAFEKYGFALGWLISTDRLMRCGRDEMKLSPLIMIDGKWKRYDPLEANTFWWDHETDPLEKADHPTDEDE